MALCLPNRDRLRTRRAQSALCKRDTLSSPRRQLRGCGTSFRRSLWPPLGIRWRQPSKRSGRKRLGLRVHPRFDGGNHPNAAGANASAYESIRAFDNIPVQGGQNEPTYTFVTGQLYVATPTSVIDADDPFGYGSIVAINRKLMATGASCGSHPLIDVSGPSSSIG